MKFYFNLNRQLFDAIAEKGNRKYRQRDFNRICSRSDIVAWRPKHSSAPASAAGERPDPRRGFWVT